MTKILDKIDKPEDVQQLTVDEMNVLAGEIRELVIETVSQTGGHLAPNLGVVELTIALLASFNVPEDKLLWDVGHQTYIYKILTDRKNRIATIRQLKGLSGFQKRSESNFDVFGAGHAGTALSASLGIAAARDLAGRHEEVVAIVGDAALCNGVSLEALNSIATTTKKFIFVLNDNEMSISENVGSFSRHLGALLASSKYNKFKSKAEDAAKSMKMGRFRSLYYRVEESVKNFFLGSSFFEELGIRYIGPVDGHDISALIEAFESAKKWDRPIVIHVATEKGRGFKPAEMAPQAWHGVSPGFDLATGEYPTKKSSGKTYSKAFGDALCCLARENKDILAITAAMSSGTGLLEFSQEFPKRFFDVGICEEHGTVFAAGLATQGKIPVFAVYSTFAQRLVDCVLHDVCLQHLKVIFCLDRAGVVGDDGPTHHGVFDIPMFKAIPGLSMMQPANEFELNQMLKLATEISGSSMIRYPRGQIKEVDIEPVPVEYGKAQVVKKGTKIQIWALGDMLELAMEVAKELDVGVVNARFIKPLDSNLVKEQVDGAEKVITLENGVLTGGFGESLEVEIGKYGKGISVMKYGWPDEFVEHGSVEQLKEIHGLTVNKILKDVL
jgi:1-deoxy-D-xylulose-5-phosphate synthase